MPDVFYNNQFWLYTVDPDAERPVMLINTHIGFDEVEGFGVMGDAFQKELLQLDALCIENNKGPIQVWINSPGGIVTDGMSIYSAILKSTTKVDTYCVGMAASIAGVIFQAGRTRIMSDYAYLMYHDPYGSDDKKGLAAMTDMIIKMIAGRSGKPEDEVAKIMNKTTWIGAEEAVETGFADKIEESTDLNKKRTPQDAFGAKAFYKESQLIVNKLFSNTKSSAMPEPTFPLSRIANKLGLHEMASQDAIVDQLASILNKKSELDKKCEDLEDEITKAKRDIDDKKAELDDLKEKHKSLKSDYDDLKKKMDEADEEDKKAKAEADKKAKAEADDKAKNLVEKAALEGRIPSDTDSMALWKKQAVADFDSTKAMIEKMPITKKMVNKIETKSQQDNDTLLSSGIARGMAEIRNRHLNKA